MASDKNSEGSNSNGTTAAEQKAIDELKSRIADVYEELEEWHRHDLYLLRFLKARDLNVNKAELMLRNNIKWRKETRVHELLNERKPNPEYFKRFPFKISGYDNEGSIVSCNPFGIHDYRSIVDNKEKEAFTQHILMTNELMYELFKFKCTPDNYVHSAVVIMDLAHYSIRQMTSMDTMNMMKELTVLIQDNYPECLKTCYVINTPKIFEVLYNMMKPVVPKAMLDKMQIFSSGSADKWKTELLKTVPADHIPSAYGGSNTTCFDYRLEMGLDMTPKLVTLPERDMKTELVPAGQKFSVDVPIAKEGEQLSWNFKTDEYDIQFSVVFHPDDDSDSDPEGEGQIIVPVTRCDSHRHIQKGTITSSKAGKYTLEWDNSYSKFRPKTLHYVYQS